MALSLRDFAQECESDIDYSTDYVLLFTWNPDNRRVGGDDDWLVKWEQMVCQYLQHIHRSCKKFCIIPEVSPAGRLHCHGWLVINDKIKWAKSIQPSLFKNGNFKSNKLRCAKGFKYYKKHIPETVGLLEHPEEMVLSHRNWKQLVQSIRKKYVDQVTFLRGNPAGLKSRDLTDMLGTVHDKTVILN